MEKASELIMKFGTSEDIAKKNMETISEFYPLFMEIR